MKIIFGALSLISFAGMFIMGLFLIVSPSLENLLLAVICAGLTVVFRGMR